jgi:hypothetical protein
MSFRRTWQTDRFLALALPALIACATASGDGADAGPGGDGGNGMNQPDAAGSCPKDPCDLLEQCGCGAPEVCDLADGTGATDCRAVAVPGMEESNCSTDEECSGGYSCFFSGTPARGQCRRYCATDTHCGPGQCLISVGNGEGQPIPGVTVCTKSCKPEAQTGNSCPSNPQFSCGLFTFMGGWITDCRPAGPGGDEADCTNAECAAGFMCVDILIDSMVDRTVCKRTCIVGDGSQCTGQENCAEFPNNPPTVNGVQYGACL